MNPKIPACVHSGRFGDAAKLLEIGVSASVDERVLAAEIALHVGDSGRARAEVQRVLTAETSPELRARCLALQATILWDDGKSAESLTLSRRAVEEADKSKDRILQCRTKAQLLERTSHHVGFDVARADAAEVRRNALQSADAQTIALVHVVFGRLEARAGRQDVAKRHFRVCRDVIDRDPNVWLQAAVDLDESVLLSDIGDISGAYDLTLSGSLLAETSGWAKGIAVAQANLACLSLLLGRIKDAEGHLAAASRQRFTSLAFEAGLTDTRAQIAILQGDYAKAEELIREVDVQSVPPWYALRLAQTAICAVEKQKRWQEALDLTQSALNLASRCGGDAIGLNIQALRSEALVHLGRPTVHTDLSLDQDTGRWNASVRGAIWRALITPLQKVGHVDRSSAALGRTARLYAAIQHEAALSSLPKDYSRGTDPSPLPAPDLESAAALLDLAGYPHILGREAVAVLAGARCTQGHALVAVGAKTRVIDTHEWTPEHAATVVEKKPADVEILPVGRHRDEQWQIVARPKTELADYCTFAAIRKIVATAVALEDYRRDEKQRAALWPAEALDGDPESIWASEQMSETLNIARRIAPSPLTVLLTGETGTGKEMLARAIHRASDRADKVFLPFNCTAVPRDMLESQLFGYRKGAFTGADTAFPGVIRSAAGGTLFLDEIADVSPDVQPKLLRFLETREIHPLGEQQPITVDVRIVAATNASLEELVAQGRFREDLFYRLNVVRLKLPPLRERREEIPPLIQHYLRRFGDEHRKGLLTVTDDALEYLLLYSWPGNVRQLANEVRRIAALAEPDSAITPALLSPEIQASRRTIAAGATDPHELRVRLDQPLPAAVEMLEQVMVRRALDRAHGRVEEASRLLGISRKGLFLKRRRWGLRQAS